ncbi:MAG: tRNA pseudouridine(38-40) synthase TruA [Bacteroidales bacterium]
MQNRYFIQLSFNGHAYHGWQIQENAITVQETLNTCLKTFLRDDINVLGAGRTDTGVHASYFMAHFDISTKIEDKGLFLNKINKLLPPDIAVQNIFKVSNEANARFDAISRTYEYRIHNEKNPFLNQFSWYNRISLDLDKMNKAASFLFNYEDFTSFSKLGTQVATNNCRIMEAIWIKTSNNLIFRIKADRFLRNMVRAIVGTLIEVGLSKIDEYEFCDIIEKKDRCLAGFSVPAHGLFLTNIEYPDGLLQPFAE